MPKNDSIQPEETPEDSESDYAKSLDEMTDEEKIDALIEELEDATESTEDSSDSSQVPKKKSRVLKDIKKLVDASKETDQNKESKKKKRFVMIKLGGAFHPNFIVNFIITYLVNLVLTIGLFNLLNLGRFPDALWVPIAFVFVYSLTEYVFRELMIANYSKLVLVSFGSIFYLGYVVLFYLVDAWVFFNIQVFNGEPELIIFTGLFMGLRQLASYAVKKGLEWKV